MSIYRVYVTRNQISRANRATGQNGDDSTVAFKRNVRAASYREAADKCIDQIWALCDPDIKVIAVYVGKKGSPSTAANRLDPIRYHR